MIKQRVCANSLSLPVVPRRKSPGGEYEFVHEADYDLTSVEGRFAWFCDEFGIDRPVLELDPDDPSAPEGILLTEKLTKWLQASGMPYDFAFVGGITSSVAVYRKKHLEENILCERVSQLDKATQKLLIEKLNLVVEGKLSIEEAIAEVNPTGRDNWPSVAV